MSTINTGSTLNSSGWSSGVAIVMKNLGASKDAEPSLKCLLGLPGVQLKAVIAAHEPIRELLAKLLIVLSINEKDEIISGVGCSKFLRIHTHFCLFRSVGRNWRTGCCGNCET